jgi:hypothetical protein
MCFFGVTTTIQQLNPYYHGPRGHDPLDSLPHRNLQGSSPNAIGTVSPLGGAGGRNLRASSQFNC